MEDTPPSEQQPLILINKQQEIFNTLEDNLQTDLESIYQLAHIANQIQNHNIFTVYTDGSLSYFN